MGVLCPGLALGRSGSGSVALSSRARAGRALTAEHDLGRRYPLIGRRAPFLAFLRPQKRRAPCAPQGQSRQHHRPDRGPSPHRCHRPSARPSHRHSSSAPSQLSNRDPRQATPRRHRRSRMGQGREKHRNLPPPPPRHLTRTRQQTRRRNPQGDRRTAHQPHAPTPVLEADATTRRRAPLPVARTRQRLQRTR